jgi:3-dehydroquinate dehydratase / shikimate dehydrogenase
MRMRMLAVAFGPPTMAAACTGLARIRDAKADCVELRLDYFEEPYDLAELLRERGGLALVATLRPPSQGGRSPLEPSDRLNVLVRAAKLGAEYVDLEWDAATPHAVSAVHDAGAQVIVSRHDFDGMPSGLADEWWPSLAAAGADVVKVVGAARDVRDCLPVLRALQRGARDGVPTIAIGMGEPGLATRVLALRSPTCLLTYAALEPGGGTAPGQLSLLEMRETYRIDRLSATTRVFGLLGPHVEGERLAEYNAWFAADNADGVAVPMVAGSEAAEIVTALREVPVSGWHIHGADLQQEVARVVHDRAGRSKVNAVVRRGDDSLEGYWVESPREQYELWRDATVG